LSYNIQYFFIGLEVCKQIYILVTEKKTTSVTNDDVYIWGIFVQHFLAEMGHRQVIRYKTY